MWIIELSTQNFLWRPAKETGRTPSLFALLAHCAAFLVSALIFPAYGQTPLALPVAAHLAAERAPMVNTGSLLAFAYRESRLHPFAVHDNATGQSLFLASAIGSGRSGSRAPRPWAQP